MRRANGDDAPEDSVQRCIRFGRGLRLLAEPFADAGMRSAVYPLRTRIDTPAQFARRWDVVHRCVRFGRGLRPGRDAGNPHRAVQRCIRLGRGLRLLDLDCPSDLLLQRCIRLGRGLRPESVPPNPRSRIQRRICFGRGLRHRDRIGDLRVTFSAVSASDAD